MLILGLVIGLIVGILTGMVFASWIILAISQGLHAWESTPRNRATRY